MRNHNHRFRMTVKTHDAADAFSPSPFRIWLPSTQHPLWTFSLLWPPLAFILVCLGTCLHHNNHHFDPHWLVFQVHHNPNIDHLQVCQGTCLCSPSTEGYGKGKVLYCYGEVVSILNRIFKILLSPPFSHNREYIIIKLMMKVVLQRASLREDEEDSEEEAEVKILSQIKLFLCQRYSSIKSQVYTLQLAQLIAVAVLLCAVWV